MPTPLLLIQTLAECQAGLDSDLNTLVERRRSLDTCLNSLGPYYETVTQAARVAFEFESKLWTCNQVVSVCYGARQGLKRRIQPFETAFQPPIPEAIEYQPKDR